MLVIINGYGQLCNRLFQYAHLKAWAIENRIKLINPSFYDYAGYFKSGKKNHSKLNYYYFKLLYRLHQKTRLMKDIQFDEDGKDYSSQLKELSLKYSLVFADGWFFRQKDLLIKHRLEIIQNFQPNNEFLKAIEEYFDKIGHFDILLSVHIRRGDYKEFNNGIYYFDNTVYKKFMDQFAKLQEGKKIGVILYSNEKIDLNKFQSVHYQVFTGPGHMISDLYAMSKTSYIMGPPSTFSMWASYYGQVPLYQIKDKNDAFTLNDFHICSG